MISLTVFFYAASRHHNDVILMPAICSASGNNFEFQQSQRTVYRHTTPCTCNSWTAASRNAKRFWAQSPNSPDLSPVDWAVMQHRVYHRQIHRVDELKRRLIDVWCCPVLSWTVIFYRASASDARYWYRNSVRPSVRLSVTFRYLDENGLTYCDTR